MLVRRMETEQGFHGAYGGSDTRKHVDAGMG